MKPPTADERAAVLNIIMAMKAHCPDLPLLHEVDEAGPCFRDLLRCVRLQHQVFLRISETKRRARNRARLRGDISADS